MMTWPGDQLPIREIPVGTIGTRYPEPRHVCSVCGCDCTDYRVEFFGFVAVSLRPIEYVLVTTCLAHWRAPLEARLRAAA